MLIHYYTKMYRFYNAKNVSIQYIEEFIGFYRTSNN